eukprot:6212308-Pleurochrysis_carterae.AAC.2
MTIRTNTNNLWYERVGSAGVGLLGLHHARQLSVRTRNSLARTASRARVSLWIGCLLGFLLHKKISSGWILVERFGVPSDRRTRSRRACHHARTRFIQSLGKRKLQGKLWSNFSRFGIHLFQRLNESTDKKIVAEQPPLRELFNCERNPFWAIDEVYKHDMSGRIYFFPRVDMGGPDLNEDSPVYPERLSEKRTPPLRPSRKIMTVPTVTITYYWSNSACGGEPYMKGTT